MGLVLKSVSFNSNGDAQLGSLYCRADGNTPIAPDANITNGDMLIGVFEPSQLGATINITIEVENTEEQSMNVFITASETMGALFGDLQFPGFICPAKRSVKVTTAVNAAYLRNWAGQMQRFYHQWKWRYIRNHTKSFDLTETTELIYVIPHLPAQPWERNMQSYSPDEINYIWTGLLDICYKACFEYEQMNGQMPVTDEEYVAAFANELNQNPSFRYDTLHGASYYSKSINSGQMAVKLNKYLEDRRKLRNRLNCTDCATLLQITCRACGIDVSNVVMTGQQAGWTENYFDTNQIIAIGCKDWAFPFSAPGVHGGFAYHEITAFGGWNGHQTQIYDACLKIDDSDYPAKEEGEDPSYRKTPLLPCKINFAETGNNVVNVPLNNAYNPVPDCYRERLVCAGQNCNILKTCAVVSDIDLSVTLQKEATLIKNSYLETVREKYGLMENPLPKLEGSINVGKVEILSEEPFLGHCHMTEDYGRNQVYRMEYEQAELRIEVTYTYHENEAYVWLLHTLAHISNPHVRCVPIGDIGYAINSTFYLFVRKNVLFEISNEVEGSTTSVEPIARTICDSL